MKTIPLVEETPEQEDFLSAARKVKELAEQGHAEAQLRLGMLYASGKGVELDYKIASDWFHKATAQNNAEAQSYLGWLYANGYGVEQDDTQAGRYYRLAAEHGLAKDQYMLACMYRWGRYGVEPDPAQMLDWYQRAAQQSYPPAQYALGKLLMNEDSDSADLLLAYQWLSLAAVKGHEKARAALNELSQQLTPEQRQQAQQALLAQLQAGDK